MIFGRDDLHRARCFAVRHRKSTSRSFDARIRKAEVRCDGSNGDSPTRHDSALRTRQAKTTSNENTSAIFVIDPVRKPDIVSTSRSMAGAAIVSSCPGRLGAMHSVECCTSSRHIQYLRGCQFAAGRRDGLSCIGARSRSARSPLARRRGFASVAALINASPKPTWVSARARQPARLRAMCYGRGVQVPFASARSCYGRGVEVPFHLWGGIERDRASVAAFITARHVPDTHVGASRASSSL